jgi:sugar lactone lactonase YvrE
MLYSEKNKAMRAASSRTGSKKRKLAKSFCLVASVLFLQSMFCAGTWADCIGSDLSPSKCQYEEQGAGDIFGSNTAPPSSMSSANMICGTVITGGVPVYTQCSDGIRQASGATNVLYDTDYTGTGTSTTCRFVDNTGANDIFVPQNTAFEFTHFITGAPTGIGFDYCVAKKSGAYPLTTSLDASCGPDPSKAGFLLCKLNPPEGTNTEEIAPVAGLPSLDLTPLPLVRLHGSEGLKMQSVGSTPDAEGDITISWVPEVPDSTPPVAISYTYSRQDCRANLNPTGAPECADHVIGVTESLVATTTANPSAACRNPQDNLDVDCDGSWVIASVATCTIDGVPSTSDPSCPPPFAPPPPAACIVNGTPVNSGDSISVVLPPVTGCPAAPGVDAKYLCTDGTVTTVNPGLAQVVSNCPVTPPPVPPPVTPPATPPSTPFTPSCSASSTVYVVDTDNSRVEAFDTAGNFLFQFGGVGSGSGQFNWPLDVRVGTDGNLLVSDNRNNRIQRFDPNGNYIGEFAVGNPDIVGQAPNGNIWVSSDTNMFLAVFNAAGSHLFNTTAWQDSSGSIGISFDADGSTWIDNIGMGTIMKVDTAGAPGFSFGTDGSGPGQLGNIWGIAVDHTNRVWVADGGNNRVEVFDTAGNLQFEFGSVGSGNGQFNTPGDVSSGQPNPMDVAIDACGNAWVTDPNNSRVEEFDSSGNFLMTFGKFGTDTTNGSGPGEFYHPFGISIR